MAQCATSKGLWLCDGVDYCHQLNTAEACCTSTAGNSTCIKDGPLGHESYQYVSATDMDDSKVDLQVGIGDFDPTREGPKQDCADVCCGCGTHGVCDTASKKCVCDKGYAGAKCDMPACNMESDLPCSGHGSCDPATNACTCWEKWMGLECSAKFPGVCEGILNCTVDKCDCMPSRCVNMCSGHGDCGEDGRCTCANDFTGLDCSFNLGCPNDCSGHGECHKMANAAGTEYHDGLMYHGKCGCSDMYTGDDCSIIDNNKIEG